MSMSSVKQKRRKKEGREGEKQAVKGGREGGGNTNLTLQSGREGGGEGGREAGLYLP